MYNYFIVVKYFFALCPGYIFNGSNQKYGYILGHLPPTHTLNNLKKLFDISWITYRYPPDYLSTTFR